jgi:hypothetical protein
VLVAVLVAVPVALLAVFQYGASLGLRDPDRAADLHRG